MSERDNGFALVADAFVSVREALAVYVEAVRPVVAEMAKLRDYLATRQFLDRDERRQRKAYPSRGQQIRMAYRRRRA